MKTIKFCWCRHCSAQNMVNIEDVCYICGNRLNYVTYPKQVEDVWIFGKDTLTRFDKREAALNQNLTKQEISNLVDDSVFIVDMLINDFLRR